VQQTHLERLWKHSVAVAAISRLLAAQYNIPTEGKEYTAGLLHDMGKLVLIQYFPEQFLSIEAMISTESISDIDAEQRIVSISHAEIGRLIGEKWRLPKEYLDVMQFHHRPGLSSNHSLLCAVVRCADLFSEQWGFGIGEQTEAFSLESEAAGHHHRCGTAAWRTSRRRDQQRIARSFRTTVRASASADVTCTFWTRVVILRFFPYVSAAMHRQRLLDISVYVFAALLLGGAIFLVHRHDQQVMNVSFGWGQRYDSLSQHRAVPSEEERRIAGQFTDTTLPQLRRLGLIKRYHRTRRSKRS
jgi:putative nucleotidyltransferase with HDIG domain